MNHDVLRLVLVWYQTKHFVWKWNVTSFPRRRMSKSHVMVGKRSHPLPNSSPSRSGCFWRNVAQSWSSHLKARTAWNREISLFLVEGDMGKGVELSSPNYFWKKPLLKDLEQEEKISSWCKVMVVSLSLPIPWPVCWRASHAECGCKNTDSLSPSSFFSNPGIPSCVPILVTVDLWSGCVTVWVEISLGSAPFSGLSCFPGLWNTARRDWALPTSRNFVVTKFFTTAKLVIWRKRVSSRKLWKFSPVQGWQPPYSSWNAYIYVEGSLVTQV